jgi:N-acetyl-anhydromuramyl-L-alanine amidase AmpD
MANGDKIQRFDEPDAVKLIKSCLPDLLLIRQRRAAYQSNRPAGTSISEIVIHDTDSTTTRFQDTVNYLANPGDGRMVSIHYIIGREAGQIIAMVPEENVANHAETRNNSSIGIELWRNTHQKGYTVWQYSALSQLVYDIMRRYGIPYMSVTGHGFSKASKRGEPHGFDWSRLDDELHRLNERVKEFDPRFAAF